MKQTNQFSLLFQRRYGPFFLTQFLGAFNDNVYKNALVILIAYSEALRASGYDAIMINISYAIFILPFLLFSSLAGELADKYEKQLLIRMIKLAEVVIMSAGAICFLYDQTIALVILLFLMGTQSAFFGPIKYSLIPQVLDRAELTGGNGLIEMGTFLAILLGTMTGVSLVSLDNGHAWAAVAVLFFAIAGYLSARCIPRLSANTPNLRISWNIPKETWKILKIAYADRGVFWSLVGISWIWFYGSMTLAQVAPLVTRYLNGTEGVVSLLLAAFSIFISLGTLMCEKLSRSRVEIGLVPFAAILMTFAACDLGFAIPPKPDEAQTVAMALSNPANWRLLMDIAVIGMSCGFFLVPLYAFVQERTDHHILSRVIAAGNIMSAISMFCSSAFAVTMLALGVTIPQLFTIAGILTGLVAIWVFRMVPEFLFRFLAWLIIHTVYRVDYDNLENIPEKGGAVIAANHVSYVDSVLISAASPRPVRFMIYHTFYNIPLIHFVCKSVGAIPIAPAKENPDLLRKAYETAQKALENGELVMIFPEGALTWDGEMTDFKPGVLKLARAADVPVIPVALRGLWGTIFSRKNAGNFRYLPRRFMSKIGIVAGSPIDNEALSLGELKETITALRGNHL